MKISTKVTHSVLSFLEVKGLDFEKLYPLIHTPEEFLKDPFSWQPANNVEYFLEKSEALFGQNLDASLIQSVGHNCAKLEAWGVLDSVLKMLHHPEQIYTKPTNFLSYFISPTPQITDIQKSKDGQISFDLDLNINTYPYFASYLISVLEALPTYKGKNLAHVSWKGQKIYIIWKDQQTSFFQNEKQVIHPRLMQNLIHGLEEKQKELESKNQAVKMHPPSLTQQLYFSQDNQNIKGYQNRLKNFNSHETLIPHIAEELQPYILKSLEHVHTLNDYFLRAKQLLAILINQAGHSSYVKEAMTRIHWDDISETFSSLTEDTTQELSKVNEVFESLLQNSYHQQKVKTNIASLLIHAVEDVVQQYPGIKIDDRHVKSHKIAGDPKALKWAFTHLARAAVSALKGQGLIKLSAHLKNQQIEITFSNRGIQECHHVPDQIHLTLALMLISMHNGQMSVQGCFDKEILFLIHIPCGS